MADRSVMNGLLLDESNELTELVLDDFEETTRPGTPSGFRLRMVRTSDDLALLMCRELIPALERRNTNATRILLDKALCVQQTLTSWELCEPEEEIRAKVINQFIDVHKQSLHELAGGR